MRYAPRLISSAPASCTLVGSGREGAGATGVEPCPGFCAGAGRGPAGESTAGPGGKGAGLHRHDPAESIGSTARCPQR